MIATDSCDFQFENSRISYQKFGCGSAALLAFHGFGQRGQVFMPLEKHLGSRFTIFALDLFFHGDSHYGDSELLTKPDWLRFMNAFLQAQGISRFSLMGFSLGGRFTLVTVEGFADRLDQLILIAPDGITRNLWYKLATGSGPGRSLFRYGLRHLSVLNGFGHVLTQLNLLNRALVRFAQISLSTPDQREQVYRSWTQFRRMRPDVNLIGKLLNTHPVQLRFFTGAFDRIVPGTYILPLTETIHHYEITILKTGHGRLIEVVAEHLM